MAVRRFSNLESKGSQPARALQIYLFLVHKAENRQTVTYKDIGDHIGYKGAGVLATVLGIVAIWCKRNALPPLTVLVVNKQSGQPGDGLITLLNLPAAAPWIQQQRLQALREDVYNADWYDIIPPSIEELRRYYEQNGDLIRFTGSAA